MKLHLYSLIIKDPNAIPTLQFLVERCKGNFDLDNKKTSEELSRILSKWKYALERKGIPDAHHLKKQSGLDYIEIHVDKSDKKLRFPYYLDSKNNLMIILMGYQKSRYYSPVGKEAKAVKKNKLLAQQYYDDYHLNREKALIPPKFINDLMNLI